MIRRKFLSVIAALPFAGLLPSPKQELARLRPLPLKKTVITRRAGSSHSSYEDIYKVMEDLMWGTQLPINQAQ